MSRHRAGQHSLTDHGPRDAFLQGNVLFVRFYEGEGAKSAYKFSGSLQQLLEQLIDVPQIVNTMPAAIRQAVMQSRE